MVTELIKKIFLIEIYLISFVFVFFLNQKWYVVCTFYTMQCTCLVKTLHGMMMMMMMLTPMTTMTMLMMIIINTMSI